ncbi:LuxR C-terminal-related transcriptional regulator [Bradyrhizobium sp. dw_78]|uniref:response regulator transcription factor n=1 Tax=Bradyrhizobium sp. dw_78 TaxID=2719793 RepID=UPI001BD369CA|nr:LuxR C-terminal-related transcriptional regulator [Bradyrhizobium sp. dw_78]
MAYTLLPGVRNGRVNLLALRVGCESGVIMMRHYHIRDHEDFADERMRPVSGSIAGIEDAISEAMLHTGYPAKCGGCHVLQKRDDLLLKLLGVHEDAEKRLSGLTHRQYQVMRLVLAGVLSKNIAVDLCISRRTVENHRASIMKRTGAKSLPELARLALAADWINPIKVTAQ